MTSPLIGRAVFWTEGAGGLAGVEAGRVLGMAYDQREQRFMLALETMKGDLMTLWLGEVSTDGWEFEGSTP